MRESEKKYLNTTHTAGNEEKKVKGEEKEEDEEEGY